MLPTQAVPAGVQKRRVYSLCTARLRLYTWRGDCRWGQSQQQRPQQQEQHARRRTAGQVGTRRGLEREIVRQGVAAAWWVQDQ